ncbi:inter-alpha-trypsin inhibitor heavy chain H4-like [Daphnia pulicaria]|uniref:inter-alpha-trypsin inhibitor heavy chain H4-like n=1 Tax=Daphnia pulicaria TaxID=35523 RepID=UPI001EEA1E1D|nr:inter-alpha-trypsin inhibitor heavy chain H4-like [Daphnia pulicaria]
MAKVSQLPSQLATVLVLLQLWLMLASASPTWVVRRDVKSATETDPQEVQDVQNTQPRIYFMDIVSDIRLRYASTKVTSKVSNPSRKAQEATFHVVLPETAFISGFLMEIDGKEYRASVKEKEKAQEEYQSAVDAGQSAAQVTANARNANQFTVSVNIEPEQKIFFNLTYEELLSRRKGIYEHAIHVTPGSVVPKMSVRVNIFETLPINKIAVPQLRGNDVEQDHNSTENEIAKIIRTNETTVVSVVYEPTEAEQIKISKDGLQGQFVVQYDVDRSSIEKKGGEIHVVDGYFVHFFVPADLPTLRKHVIFVLDTSGSMVGTRIEQTKQAMNSILDQLRKDEDIFSVVEFSSAVTEWDLRKPYKGPDPYYYMNSPPEDATAVPQNNESEVKFGPYDDILAYPVTEQSVKRAKEFVAAMEVTSSTNINDALLLALKNSQSVQSRVRLTPIIIFLTDGEPTASVTDTTEILKNVRKGNSDDVVSIFCLAFGTGTDYQFLTKISSQNRGFSRKIYEAADATLQLKGFFDEVASPLLSNVNFVYNNNGPVKHDVTETTVPNFFRGTEFVVAGRIDPKFNLSASISGTGVSGSFLFPNISPIIRICAPRVTTFGCPDILVPAAPNVTVVTKPKKSFSLEKIWAYMTIQDMLRKRQIIDDAKRIVEINQKALNLSLAYDFVTPLTSLVVVKPNSTATAADLRPADAQTFDDLRGPSPVYALSAAPAPPFIVGGIPPPNFAQISVVETIFESFELATENSPESEYGTVESETLAPEPFVPENWIKQFDHNATHVNIASGNETFNLLWTYELPDIEYESCSTHRPHDAICKSIWKCSKIVDGANRLLRGSIMNGSTTCIIENKYLGVCCDSTKIPSIENTTASEQVTENVSQSDGGALYL